MRKTIQGHLNRRGIPVKTAKVAKDLGVSTTAGVRRVSATLKGTITAAQNRVRRVKTLNRVNKGASKLYNTGAWPQSIYGKDTMGLDMATLKKVRAMAADAVSGPAKGKCPSTCIWLGLGEN